MKQINDGSIFLLDIYAKKEINSLNEIKSSYKKSDFFKFVVYLVSEKFFALTSSTSLNQTLLFPSYNLKFGVCHHILITY